MQKKKISSKIAKNRIIRFVRNQKRTEKLLMDVNRIYQELNTNGNTEYNIGILGKHLIDPQKPSKHLRSGKRTPYIEPSFRDQIQKNIKQREEDIRRNIDISEKRYYLYPNNLATHIPPNAVGMYVELTNGLKKNKKVLRITEDMIMERLGVFVFTRKILKHSGNKEAKR